MRTLLLLFITVTAYLIGAIIYCILNFYRIGEKDWLTLADDREISDMDIILESFFWPLVLPIQVILWPFRRLKRYIRYRQNKNRNKN